MTTVSLDGGSLISALWKGRRFDLEGRSLGNHLTWLPHFRDGEMRSRDAWCFTQRHTASRCYGSHFTRLSWLSVKSSITCTRGWMAPLYTVGKLLTQWPQIIRCSASFDFVTPARVRTRGIQVYGSRKVLKLFTSVTSSLNRTDEEELPLILLRALSVFTCSMRILTTITLRPDLIWLCAGIMCSCDRALGSMVPHSCTFFRGCFNTANLFSYVIWFYISQKKNSSASFIQSSKDKMNS